MLSPSAMTGEPTTSPRAIHRPLNTGLRFFPKALKASLRSSEGWMDADREAKARRASISAQVKAGSLARPGPTIPGRRWRPPRSAQILRAGGSEGLFTKQKKPMDRPEANSGALPKAIRQIDTKIARGDPFRPEGDDHAPKGPMSRVMIPKPKRQAERTSLLRSINTPTLRLPTLD